MLLLQSVITNHQCVLWAERTIAPSDIASRGPKGRLPEHPFAATQSELVSAIDAVISKRIKADTITVWLPTAVGQPVPSSPLIGDTTEGEQKIQPWKLSACALDASLVLDLFAVVGDGPTLAAGIGVGVTLRYWAAAMRFATALVTRQQFLPDLVQHTNGWFARWTPVIGGGRRDSGSPGGRGSP